MNNGRRSVNKFKTISLTFILITIVIVTNGFSQIEQELNKLLYPEEMDTSLATGQDTVKKAIPVQFNEMVYIPAGNFIMGSEEFELDERPVRQVFLEKFWIDKYPVTNQQYADFLNQYIEMYPDRQFEIEKLINLEAESVKIILQEDRFVPVDAFENHPVVHVSWYGADAYARFYNKRLPTEAEWEKAARGIEGRIYPWGDVIDSSKANYWDSKDPFEEGTTPVGFYNGGNYQGFQTSDSHSPFGVYDMVGNVKEWVSDWYQWDYYSKSTKIDPKGPQSGVKKVVRGGGYLFHAKDLRTTLRYALKPNESTSFIGFRCASSIEPDTTKVEK